MAELVSVETCFPRVETVVRSQRFYLTFIYMGRKASIIVHSGQKGRIRFEFDVFFLLNLIGNGSEIGVIPVVLFFFVCFFVTTIFV